MLRHLGRIDDLIGLQRHVADVRKPIGPLRVELPIDRQPFGREIHHTLRINRPRASSHIMHKPQIKPRRARAIAEDLDLVVLPLIALPIAQEELTLRIRLEFPGLRLVLVDDPVLFQLVF